MKRYLLFSGADYYPGGGWDDFKDSYEEVSEAILAAEARGDDWSSIVDTQTGKELYFFANGKWTY